VGKNWTSSDIPGQKGKVIAKIQSENTGAKLELMQLVKYNFIIAAKFSPYNCKKFCIKSQEYFGRLLKNELEFDEFVTWMKSLPKNDNDD